MSDGPVSAPSGLLPWLQLNHRRPHQYLSADLILDMPLLELYKEWESGTKHVTSVHILINGK